MLGREIPTDLIELLLNNPEMKLVGCYSVRLPENIRKHCITPDSDGEVSSKIVFNPETYEFSWYFYEVASQDSFYDYLKNNGFYSVCKNDQKTAEFDIRKFLATKFGN